MFPFINLLKETFIELLKMTTLKINYGSNKSELCEIGRKYDTDKSSQRNNVSDTRHCHPYTLFYENLFKNKRNEKLTIAELGILEGASLRMWQEYFPNADIHGFEYNDSFINNFKNNYDNSRITLSKINVNDVSSITSAFNDITYDIIIEDTTHQFEDQIRVIENVYNHLKPGGILIIEDIFKSYKEQDYIDKLVDVLPQFQDYYFVELDHNNKNSTGWDNDKLFVLVKSGAEPIFKNENKITIITPSYRVTNLPKLKESINFDYIHEWIIVYDGSKIKENPKLFKHPKIKEFVHLGQGISGNPQRNYALTQVSNKDTLLYYLDDDNIIHPDLYRLLNVIDNRYLYTFNQKDRLKGNNINIGSIDTAMVIVPYSTCKDELWIPSRYDADGYYIKVCYQKNKAIFVDNDLCYYNKVS